MTDWKINNIIGKNITKLAKAPQEHKEAQINKSPPCGVRKAGRGSLTTAIEKIVRPGIKRGWMLYGGTWKPKSQLVTTRSISSM